MLEYRLSM
jgi:choline kinase